MKPFRKIKKGHLLLIAGCVWLLAGVLFLYRFILGVRRA